MVRVERSCVSAKVCWGRAGNRPEGITCKCGNSGMLTQNLGWWCIALQKQNQVGGNDTSGRGLDKTWGINRARGSHAGQQCATRKDSTKAAEARSLRMKLENGVSARRTQNCGGECSQGAAALAFKICGWPAPECGSNQPPTAAGWVLVAVRPQKRSRWPSMASALSRAQPGFPSALLLRQEAFAATLPLGCSAAAQLLLPPCSAAAAWAEGELRAAGREVGAPCIGGKAGLAAPGLALTWPLLPTLGVTGTCTATGFGCGAALGLEGSCMAGPARLLLGRSGWG